MELLQRSVLNPSLNGQVSIQNGVAWCAGLSNRVCDLSWRPCGAKFLLRCLAPRVNTGGGGKEAGPGGQQA